MAFFREIYFEVKWMFEEVVILCKHPSRKASWTDLKYHWSKLMSVLFFHPWYCLKRGIRNLCIWFPLIWRNDCWDYFQLMELIDKQLKEMEDFWKKGDTMSVGAYHYGKRIAWTRKLMKMWRDEYYVMQHYDEYTTRYPKQRNMFDKSVPSTIDEYGIVTSYRLVNDSTEEQTQWYRETSEIARKKDEKVYKLWLKNFGRVREWWD